MNNVPCTPEPHLSVHMGPTPDREITRSKMLPFSITILQIAGAPKSIGITSSQLQDRVGKRPDTLQSRARISGETGLQYTSANGRLPFCQVEKGVAARAAQRHPVFHSRLPYLNKVHHHCQDVGRHQPVNPRIVYGQRWSGRLHLSYSGMWIIDKVGQDLHKPVKYITWFGGV
ncbi:hypothetical protein BDV97DRAFT_162124 [Delphinella strobiligena]|nr:hypothetical protein BDV97DRAFT_162124 [Delphinella strobiligena]